MHKVVKSRYQQSGVKVSSRSFSHRWFRLSHKSLMAILVSHTSRFPMDISETLPRSPLAAVVRACYKMVGHPSFGVIIVLRLLKLAALPSNGRPYLPLAKVCSF